MAVGTKRRGIRRAVRANTPFFGMIENGGRFVAMPVKNTTIAASATFQVAISAVICTSPYTATTVEKSARVLSSPTCSSSPSVNSVMPMLWLFPLDFVYCFLDKPLYRLLKMPSSFMVFLISFLSSDSLSCIFAIIS